MWCVLGTLGRLLKEDAAFCDPSLFFRFLLSLPALPSLRAAGEAVTDWPAATSLAPLSDLEGLDEEHRRWCPRTKIGAEAATALGAEGARQDTRLAWGPEDTTRRTDEGNIVSPGVLTS
jgi:hypothetical protein